MSDCYVIDCYAEARYWMVLEAKRSLCPADRDVCAGHPYCSKHVSMWRENDPFTIISIRSLERVL